MLRGALALGLRHALGALRALLGHCLLLLHAFAAHRAVARYVSRRLLTATEQLVQESHSSSSFFSVTERRLGTDGSPGKPEYRRCAAKKPPGSPPGTVATIQRPWRRKRAPRRPRGQSRRRSGVIRRSAASHRSASSAGHPGSSTALPLWARSHS